MCLLADALTKGELKLVERGEQDSVLALRRKYQDLIRDEGSQVIEQVTGRRVVSFMSDSTVQPDMAAEIFVLEPRSDDDEAPAATAES